MFEKKCGGDPLVLRMHPKNRTEVFFLSKLFPYTFLYNISAMVVLQPYNKKRLVCGKEKDPPGNVSIFIEVITASSNGS